MHLKFLVMNILMNSINKSLLPFGLLDSVSNNSSLRTEGTQNNLFFKSIKGNDSPGKLYKPFPNRKLYKPNFLKAWMNYSFAKIDLSSI